MIFLKFFSFLFSVLAGQYWDIYHRSVGTLSLPYPFKNGRGDSTINILAPELFFLILAHPVYKM